MEYNNSKLKFIAKPAIIFLVSLFLLIIALVFGLNRINDIKEKIASTQTLNVSYTKKIEVLEKVDSDIKLNLGLINVTIPDKNTAILGVSQIKNKASEFGLALSNLKVSNSEDIGKGLKRVPVSFSVSGESSNVYAFFDSLKKILPVLHLSKISLNEISGSITAEAVVNFYSSDPIKKIPSLAENTKSLTSEEVKLLQEILHYEQPKFISPQAVEYPVREDLFNF